MAFMTPHYTKDTFAAWTERGEGFLAPADHADTTEADGGHVELLEGWFGRLSADGYLDACDWSGPFATELAAIKAIADQYEVCGCCGEEFVDGTPLEVYLCADCDGYNDAINDAIESYIETALWSSVDENGDPLDKNYSTEDVAPNSIASMKADVRSFLSAAIAKFGSFDAIGLSPERFGHDFWLTRNYHGAGFWDEGIDAGAELTKMAHAEGSSNITLWDDGKLHLDDEAMFLAARKCLQDAGLEEGS